MHRIAFMLTLVAFAQTASAQLALPIALPKITHINVAVGRSALARPNAFFDPGVLKGPTEVSAEVSFDAGTRQRWLGLTRLEVALAYKYHWGVSSRIPGVTIVGHGQTLPELSLYSTHLNNLLGTALYPYAGLHIGVFSLSGFITSETSKAKFSAQMFAPGVSLGLAHNSGWFIQASLHVRDLPEITYEPAFSGAPTPNFPNAPLYANLSTFTLQLGVQIDIGTTADELSKKKTQRELVDETLRHCPDLRQPSCGEDLLNVAEKDRAGVQELIKQAKDRLELEQRELANKLKAAQQPSSSEDKEPKPTKIQVMEPVKVIIEGGAPAR